MRVTGATRIAAHMALTVAGDTANNLPKIRGLFTSKWDSRPGDVAMLLREGKVGVRDGDHLSEMIKIAAAGDNGRQHGACAAVTKMPTRSDSTVTGSERRPKIRRQSSWG